MRKLILSVSIINTKLQIQLLRILFLSPCISQSIYNEPSRDSLSVTQEGSMPKGGRGQLQFVPEVVTKKSWRIGSRGTGLRTIRSSSTKLLLKEILMIQVTLEFIVSSQYVITKSYTRHHRSWQGRNQNADGPTDRHGHGDTVASSRLQFYER